MAKKLVGRHRKLTAAINHPQQQKKKGPMTMLEENLALLEPDFTLFRHYFPWVVSEKEGSNISQEKKTLLCVCPLKDH